MEDAATAEVSRSQVWQWAYHGVHLVEGGAVSRELVRRILDEELGKIRAAVGLPRVRRLPYGAAQELFEAVALGEPFVEFLTLPASERIDLQRSGRAVRSGDARRCRRGEAGLKAEG